MCRIKDISGLLIKYNREKKDIGQKELANGICAVSHLSKIENSREIGNKYIIKELFKRLDIDYNNDSEFIEYGYKKIEKHYKNTIYLREDKELKEELRKNRDRYINSPLIISYLIGEFFYINIYSKRNIDIYKDKYLSLKNLYEFMTSKEKALFYLIENIFNKDMTHSERMNNFNKSIGLLNNSLPYSMLINYLYSRGDYIYIIDIKYKALEIAGNEGNINAVIHINNQIGNSFANLGFPDMMLTYYERVANIMEFSDVDNFKYMNNYNIGATYQTLEDYDKALYYLEDVEFKNDDYMNFMKYHKLAYLYKDLNRMDEAKNSYKILKNIINSIEYKNFDDIDRLMVEIIGDRLKDNYMEDKRYIEKLEKLCEELKRDKHYGIYLFHRKYLEEAYIENRMYKKAYELLKQDNF